MLLPVWRSDNLYPQATPLMWDTAVSGFLGAFGALLVWEGILKPARERRAIAATLAEEVARNLKRVAALEYSIRRNPSFLPFRPRLSSVVLNAILPKLGEIRRYDVGSIVELYGQFDEIASEVVRFEPVARRNTDYQADVSDRPDQQRHLLKLADCLQRAVELGYTVLDSLGENGAPGWTRRRWRPDDTPELLEDGVPESETAAAPPNEALQQSGTRK